MKQYSRWVAAALLSTSLIFSADFAEAKAKHKDKTHKAHVHKKKTAKKVAKKHGAKHAKAQKKSPGYAKAAGYMNDRSPASVKSSKHKTKKAKKTRRT